MKDYKMVTLTNLILTLRSSYIAACKALGLANKLKNGKYKAHCMGMMNKIRAELNKYDKGCLSIFETIAYRGVLVNKF